jgi:uncharacterized membrane protein
MSQTLQTIVRTILMIVGSFLIGHHFMNQTIDSSIWETITGSVISVITLIWDLKSKIATQDQIAGTFKQVLVFVLGFFAASGKISADSVQTWITIIGTVLTAVLSIFYKKASPTVTT